jgi:HD-GYP domain-containing protein (c-di-GMP phosphodiesterase class II)
MPEIMAKHPKSLAVRQEPCDGCEALQRALETLAAGVTDGLLVLDAAGDIRYASTAAARLLARRPAELLGQPFGIPPGVGELGRMQLVGPAPARHCATVELHSMTLDWGGTGGRLVALRDVSDEELAAERLERVLFQTVTAMANTVEKRDPYTAGHQNRVADLAARLGAALGLPRRCQEGLRMGGLIHDIGKVYVPAEILGRPGPLTAAEYELVTSHARVGHDIVKGIESPWPLAEVVLQHHERLDGSGYPDGLGGDDILPEARILAVADVMEAMTSHRPYRPARSLDTALGELSRGRGLLFEADVVDACVELFRARGYRFPEAP